MLTNADGFSAHVVAEISSSSNDTRTVSGELLCREGRLIFQPANHEKTKRNHVSNKMTFLWDATKQQGYVVNEALQGYAPISPAVEVSRLDLDAKNAVPENVNGRACHRVTAQMGLLDGSAAKFTVWQTDDAKQVPVRVQSVNSPKSLNLSFSGIHLENPPAELFLLPDGYTKYASAGALMSELLIRQVSAGKKADTQLPSDMFPDQGPPGGNAAGHQPGMIH